MLLPREYTKVTARVELFQASPQIESEKFSPLVPLLEHGSEYSEKYVKRNGVLWFQSAIALIKALSHGEPIATYIAVAGVGQRMPVNMYARILCTPDATKMRVNAMNAMHLLIGAG